MSPPFTHSLNTFRNKIGHVCLSSTFVDNKNLANVPIRGFKFPKKKTSEKNPFFGVGFVEPLFKWNPSFLGLHSDTDSPLAKGVEQLQRNQPGEKWLRCEHVCVSESTYSVVQRRVFPPTRLPTCLMTRVHTREITSREVSQPIYCARSSPARLRPWVCISPVGRLPNNKAHPCLSISQRVGGGVKYAGSLWINN